MLRAVKGFFSKKKDSVGGQKQPPQRAHFKNDSSVAPTAANNAQPTSHISSGPVDNSAATFRKGTSLRTKVLVLAIKSTAEELLNASAEQPLCSAPKSSLSYRWHLKAHVVVEAGQPKLKCVLHCSPAKSPVSITATYSLYVGKGSSPFARMVGEGVIDKDNHCCSVLLRDSNKLLELPKFMPVTLEVRVTHVKPVRASPPSDSIDVEDRKAEGIQHLVERLSSEIEQNERLQASLRVASVERDKAEALLDEIVKGELLAPHAIAAQCRAERELTLSAEQENEALVERLNAKEKEVAELAAQLVRKSSFALDARERTQALRAKMEASHLEIRQTQGVLSWALSTHEEMARQLQESQHKLKMYADAAVRQRIELARHAALQRNLRAEITERQVMRASKQQYIEEQLKAFANSVLDQQFEVAADKKALCANRVDEEEVRAMNDLRQQLDAVQGMLKCVICMDRQRSVSFVCGHTACSECASALRKCHICRRAISKHFPIYL